MRRQVFFSILIAGVASLFASEMPAKPGNSSGNCGTVWACWDEPYFDHKVLGPGPGVWYLHGDCGRCLVAFEDCHPDCSAENEEPAVRENYSKLIDAAVAKDIDRVVKLMYSVPQFAFVNQARQSIQILSCDGQSVVANLPLGERRDLLTLNGLASANEIAGLTDHNTESARAETREIRFW